jgi:uncharacterized membrane-anchored protein YhcB (DUF1043 family)
MRYGIIVVCCFCLLMLGTRACETPVQTRQNIDTMQGKVDKYKAQIDSMKTEYLTLLNSRAVKIKTLREIRTKYVHDTLTVENLVGDTSGIANLLSENALMKEIIFEDSLIIANQGQVVIYQDSVISQLEAIRDTQKDLLNECANEVKKQRKKASFWRSVAIALGIVAIAK